MSRLTGIGLQRTLRCARFISTPVYRSLTSLTGSSHPDRNPLSMRREQELRSVEKLVGYPTPLLSLRHLLGTGFTQLSDQIRRLLSSQHPVVKHTRWLQEEPHTMQKHGLITLLTSKAVNVLNPILPEVDQFGILPSQRALAEVTEMIHSALLLHMEVVSKGEEEEMKEEEKQQLLSDLAFGNKLVILGGDMLLARACRELAQLYVPKVVDLISQAISDAMTASYWDINHSQYALPDPALPLSSGMNTSVTHNISPSLESIHSWRYEAYMYYASLLKNSCAAVAVLAELGPLEERLAAEFGHHLGVAQQALKDRRAHQQNQYLEKPLTHSGLHDWQEDVCVHHCQLALDTLGQLPDSDAVVLLEDHVHGVMESVARTEESLTQEPVP